MTDHQLSRRSALVGLGGTAVGALSVSLLGAPAAGATTAAPQPAQRRLSDHPGAAPSRGESARCCTG
jgi:hypothetical protein